MNTQNAKLFNVAEIIKNYFVVFVGHLWGKLRQRG